MPTTSDKPGNENTTLNAADDLTAGNVRTIAQLERAAKSGASVGERMSFRIAAFCGSMPFVWIHVAGFSDWIYLNSAPQFAHADPFPFTFLTLVVSLEAISLSTFILISQNHETRLTEKRSHLDLQINLLTEQENTKMLQMLERIAERVEADVSGDPDVAVLEESTKPERLVKQIDKEASGIDGAAK